LGSDGFGIYKQVTSKLQRNITMDFTEKFKTYTNTELLRIINNPEGYQPIAVGKAKKIFKDRQLSDEEIKFAQNELEKNGQEKLNKEQK